jgi:hypothetical protein
MVDVALPSIELGGEEALHEVGVAYRVLLLQFASYGRGPTVVSRHT